MIYMIDVKPYHWFYNDITELNNLILSNGNRFIEGIPYTSFKSGYEPIDTVVSIEEQDYKSSEITVNRLIYPNDENPINVYIDGNPVSIETIIQDTDNNKTIIKLSRTIPFNSYYKIFYSGEPQLYVRFGNLIDTEIFKKDGDNYVSFSTPQYKSYGDLNNPYITTEGEYYKFEISPQIDGEDYAYAYIDNSIRLIPLGSGGGIKPRSDITFNNELVGVNRDYNYIYNPFYSLSTETCYWSGKQLRRVDSEEDIYYDYDYTVVYDDVNDKYEIVTNFDLNNEILVFSYLKEDGNGLISKSTINITVSTDNMIYTNRFFTGINISRAEVFTFIDRLRDYFYYKYSDTTAPQSTESSSRFTDVNYIKDTYGTPWWWQHILNLEQILLEDGTYFILGSGGNLKPNDKISRAEIVTVLDKFRVWVLQAFK